MSGNEMIYAACTPYRLQLLSAFLPGDVELNCADGKILVLTSKQSKHFYFKLPCIEQSWSEPEYLQDGELSFIHI